MEIGFYLCPDGKNYNILRRMGRLLYLGKGSTRMERVNAAAKAIPVQSRFAPPGGQGNEQTNQDNFRSIRPGAVHFYRGGDYSPIKINSMTIEQIKSELAEIEAQIKSLNARRDEKIAELLKAESEASTIQPGDRVLLYKITFSGAEKLVGEGIAGGFYLRYGNTKQFFFKVKKDGSQSIKKWSPYDFGRAEKTPAPDSSEAGVKNR